MSTTTKAQLESLRQQIAQQHTDGEHLQLMAGSPTYGRAWRLYFEVENGGLSSYPGLDNGYLGWTKHEAYQTMRGILAGMEAQRLAQGDTIRAAASEVRGEIRGPETQALYDGLVKLAPPGEF